MKPRIAVVGSINLDLVARARDILETRTATDTIHRALEDVIQRDDLARLAEWDLGGMTPDDLDRLRGRPSGREWSS